MIQLWGAQLITKTNRARCARLRFTQGIAMLAISLAWRVFAHGDIHLQIEAINAKLLRAPGNAELILQRSELWRVHGEFTNALADLDQAAAYDPKLDTVHLLRGRVYAEMKRPALATNSLTQFLVRHPKSAIAYIERARSLEQLGQPFAAAADLTQAIPLAAEAGPDLYLERARLLRAAGVEHLESALAGLTEGIRKLGPLVTLELFAIELELDLKRYDSALDRIERIAAQSPRKETWLVRRAEILAQAGRPVEARYAWEQARAAFATLPEQFQQTKASRQFVERIQTELAKGVSNQNP